MQNLAQFQTTSKFSGEYLRNRWRYSKSDKYFLYRDSSHVGWKKFGELWYTNHGYLVVKSQPKSTFSGDHILAPSGCCAPKFLHVLANGQVLPSHTPMGMGSPLQFFSKGIQYWLKF